MITEEKILRYYNAAIEAGHPAPDRAIFGRLGMTGADPSYDKDGKMGLFGVSKKLVTSIGMDIDDNADASFDAMMHFDTMHISESNDVAEGMAKTAGEKDVDSYSKSIDNSTAEYADKIEWNDGRPARFKDATPDLEEKDPLEGAETEQEVKSKAKELTASYSHDSSYNASLGLGVDAKSEYDRLINLLKGTIAKLV